MPVTARRLLGREEELSAIVGFLETGERLPGGLVLRGEAGIGKTELWLAGVEAAKGRGYRILTARPNEAEASFSFGGLADLLRRVAGEVLPELPPVQRRALEAALLLTESEARVADRAVAAAFLSVLQLLAAEVPVCVAIDDLQWLDAASRTVLRYALDRLDGESVAALMTIRGDLPHWLRRATLTGRVLVVEPAGLDVGAVRELLHSRLDATFSRPTLVKLTRASGGNPFFVIELAAALQRRGGTVGAGEELPVPADLDALVGARLDGLGPAAIDVACVVAALADPTVALVESAVAEHPDSGLAEVLAARVVETDGERLRFAHPLVRSVVIARQTPSLRRSVHARLAGIVVSTEQRAWHLALSSRGPDDGVASTIESAARSLHARGAPTAAAELAEQALRLTTASQPDDALRRLLLAADMHRRAGDTARATDLLETALSEVRPGDARAQLLTCLAEATQPPASIPLYYDALSEAADKALQATIHSRLAAAMRWGDGVEAGLRHAELAVRAAAEVTDRTVRCEALAALGMAQFHAGRGIMTEIMDEAMCLERSMPEWPLDDGPTIKFGAQLVWSADVERGRELFQGLLQRARARQDPASEAEALWYLAFLDWRAGDWIDAEAYICESLKLMRQFGSLVPPNELPAAIIAAHRGQVDAARSRALAAVDRAKTSGIRIAESGHGWVLGFVELSLGDPVAALVHLRRAYEIRNVFMLDPAQHLELGDLLEALIVTGEFDEADGILATWEPRARALDRAWALAILARCRGLLLGARGDLDGALMSLERARAQHARCQDPFQHARTLLALGRTMRRARQRAAARAVLTDARERLDRLGAPLWAAQAHAELGRIGGRRATDGELTEAEHRIATLVATGQTNREVAAALFLTEHSVETALTQIYRKLGIRSRTSLAHRIVTVT